MRRPLAFACALIVVCIYAGVITGLFPLSQNKELPADGEYITMTGSVKEIHDNYIVMENATNGKNSGIYVIYFDDIHEDEAHELMIGEGIKICGRYADFSHAMNPGQFDAYDYYSSKGYDGSVRYARLLSHDGNCSAVREALRRLNVRLKERIYSVCPEKEASILSDLLLGDKEEIDSETKTLYQNNGIAHILSISGLHISILGMGLYRLLRKMRCPNTPSAMSAAFILVLYCMMTGMSVSAVRATGMFVIRMFSHLFGRSEDQLTSLSLMAALTAVSNPLTVTGSGFLLSYGAALGIFVFLPAVSGLFFEQHRDKEKLFREDTLINRASGLIKKICIIISKALVSSFLITMFTLPVQLYFFYRVSTYSVFLNLIILPCMSLLVFSGMLMMVPGLGITGTAACILLDIFERLCRLAEKLPFHEWNPGRPGITAIAIYYIFIILIIIICISAGNHIAYRGIVIFLLASMLFVIRFPLPAHNTSTQLYVGQGNCNVTITDSGEVFIFDGGSSSQKNIGEYIIRPFLKIGGLSHIDGIFISHSDSDHINGCLELIENMDAWGLEIGGVYITPQMMNDGTENTRRLLEGCDSAGIPVACISAGDEWDSGDTHFVCLHPAKEFIPEDPNSGSMCILVSFVYRSHERTNINTYSEIRTHPAAHTMLIPGDIQGSGEKELAKNLALLSIDNPAIDIYLTAHHGSSGSSSEEFLDIARPRLAVNSAGLNNVYGHPHAETLARLEAAGCACLNTFDTGAVTLDFSEKDIKISAFCSN